MTNTQRLRIVAIDADGNRVEKVQAEVSPDELRQCLVLMLNNHRVNLVTITKLDPEN